MEQHICQIYIEDNINELPARAFYHTGLNGRYKASVVGITFTDDTANGDHRLIQIKSDCFRINYGSKRNTLLVGNKGDHSQGQPGGAFGPFFLEVMGGGIDLELKASTDYTGVGNDKFFFCILTLLVEKVE